MTFSSRIKTGATVKPGATIKANKFADESVIDEPDISDSVIKDIQKALLPVNITDDTDKIKRDGQRVAAVLIGLVKRKITGHEKAQWHVILTQRPETMPSHAGQIAFPGGKGEKDETILQTALRETQEEIGLEPSAVKIIGRLPSFNAVSQYRITPFIGVVPSTAALKADPREVAEIFEVPLDFLMNAENHVPRRVNYEAREIKLIDMPYRGDDGRHRHIWGMTAMMLFRLYQRYKLDLFETDYA